MQKVQFSNADSNASFLTNRKLLKIFLPQIISFYKMNYNNLTIVFCTDDYLLDINQKYLNHHFYTDIITFNLSSIPNTVEGEIYISVDRVKENANKHHSTLITEMHRVICHGVLHLCGLKDKSKKEGVLMRQAEDYWLSQYFK